MARPLGLTAAWWQVLGALLKRPLSVAGIAREMDITRQSVQRIADLLVERGVSTEPGPPPRQARRTDSGRARGAVRDRSRTCCACRSHDPRHGQRRAGRRASRDAPALDRPRRAHRGRHSQRLRPHTSRSHPLPDHLAGRPAEVGPVERVSLRLDVVAERERRAAGGTGGSSWRLC